MKIITKEEVEKLHLLPVHGRSGLVEKLSEMKINEILFIPKEDWSFKSSPIAIVCSGVRHPRSLIFNMKFNMRRAEEGWVITKYE